MAANESANPNALSLDEPVAYFETHDMGEQWEHLEKAEFDIDLGRRLTVVALDEDVAEKVVEIAHSRHVPAESLVNTWLRERALAENQG